MLRPPRTYRVSEGVQALIEQIAAATGFGRGQVIEVAVLAMALELRKEGKLTSGNQEATHSS